MMARILALVRCACSYLLFSICFANAALAQVEAAPIESNLVTAFDLGNPDRKQFGKLRFVGGLVLRSSNRHFGALSGFRMRPDNGFYAISDTGYWFHARLERNDDGMPAGLAGGRLAPILDENGKPFPDKWSIDAESLAFDNDTAFISTEQNGRILSFPSNETPGTDFLMRRSRAIELDFSGEKISWSFGLEALAIVKESPQQGDVLLAITEGSKNNAGDVRAFLNRSGQTEELSVKRRDDFYITDAQFIKRNDLLILERRYSLARGPQVRIRRINTEGNLKSGVVLDGEIIFEADRSQQIDNMEGLSVFKGPDSKTRIGLVSDNNHWLLQRTLYLEFVLTE